MIAAWRAALVGAMVAAGLGPAAGLAPRAAGAAPHEAPLRIAGSNRMEYGLARRDGRESFEDLFRLALGWRGFTAEARLHVLEPSQGAAAESLDQRAFGWSDGRVELLAGNFYETWGHGLLLRAYESRTATVGRIERSLAFDRDIDGFRARGREGPFTATVLSGRPLRTAVSGNPGPARPERPDRVRGARLEVAPSGVVRGAASFLRINAFGSNGAPLTDQLASGEVSATGDWLDVTLEGAVRRPSVSSRLPDGDAIYTAVSAFQGPFAITWEYKDYNHFAGAYNEPPTLVKTQSWTLLNRQTHVAEADDAVGHQFEAAWSADSETGLTLNHSRSDRHDEDPDFRFREWTLEGRHRLGAAGPRLRAVVDRARDVLKGDDRRWTAGVDAEIFLDDTNSVDVTAEWQRVDPLFGDRVTRRLAQVEYQRAPWLTVTAQAEKSDQRGIPRTRWSSLTVNLAFLERHNLNLWYGTRPAGFLCTGGYCFFAPAFDGFEARLLTRF